MSTAYFSPLPLRDQPHFVLNATDRMLDELAHDGGPLGFDIDLAPDAFRQPPQELPYPYGLYRPRPQSMKPVVNCVFPGPRGTADVYYPSVPQFLPIFGSATPSFMVRQRTPALPSPPSPRFTFPTQNFYGNYILPPSPPALHSPPFFHPETHYTPSPINSVDLPLPPFPDSPPLDTHDTPALFDATHPQYSDASPIPSSSRSILKTLPFIPSVRFTDEALKHGVLCSSLFQCKWDTCRVKISLEDPNDEEKFQRTVRAHIDTHARPQQADGTRDCMWESCTTASGAYKTVRTMDRHIKTHVKWRVFCEHCDSPYGRAAERGNHEEICEPYQAKLRTGVMERKVAARARVTRATRPPGKKVTSGRTKV